MPRILTPTAAQAILARETGEVFLVLLTVTHPDLDTIRIVNNTELVAAAADSLLLTPKEK